MMVNETWYSRSRGFFRVQFTLRISVITFTLAAIITTVTTKKSLEQYGLIEEFNYRGSPPIRFQIGANAVVGFLCLCSLILLLYSLKDSISDPHNYFQLFLHDMVMAVVSMAGCAAATGEKYLAVKGEGINSVKIWPPYCSRVQKFCHRMFGALVLSYLAFFCMFILALMAAHKLKNPY